MKLAALPAGGRDGRLAVVSGDIAFASDAAHIAPTLQAALDDWERLAPHLELVARGVASGGQPVTRFHEREACAPLPRAHRYARAARAPDPDDRGGAGLRDAVPDRFAAPRDPVALSADAAGIEVEVEVAVIVEDVARGADRATALAAIRLVLLVAGLSDGGGVSDGLAPALSPVAVTPDELGEAWDGARLRGALTVEVNGALRSQFGADGRTLADFGDLIQRAARDRPLSAGAIIGSGALAAGAFEAAPSLGLKLGDSFRIEMRDGAGRSIFGAIERTLTPWSSALSSGEELG